MRYEDSYIRDYASVMTLRDGLSVYFLHHNYKKPHESLGTKRLQKFILSLKKAARSYLVTNLNFVDSWSS